MSRYKHICIIYNFLKEPQHFSFSRWKLLLCVCVRVQACMFTCTSIKYWSWGLSHIRQVFYLWAISHFLNIFRATDKFIYSEAHILQQEIRRLLHSEIPVVHILLALLSGADHLLSKTLQHTHKKIIFIFLQWWGLNVGLLPSPANVLPLRHPLSHSEDVSSVIYSLQIGVWKHSWIS